MAVPWHEGQVTTLVHGAARAGADRLSQPFCGLGAMCSGQGNLRRFPAPPAGAGGLALIPACPRCPASPCPPLLLTRPSLEVGFGSSDQKSSSDLPNHFSPSPLLFFCFLPKIYLDE